MTVGDLTALQSVQIRKEELTREGEKEHEEMGMVGEGSQCRQTRRKPTAFANQGTNRLFHAGKEK